MISALYSLTELDPQGPVDPDLTLAEILAQPWPCVRRRFTPFRADVPEDEDGECFFCHGRPSQGGCGTCGAPGPD